MDMGMGRRPPFPRRGVSPVDRQWTPGPCPEMMLRTWQFEVNANDHKARLINL